MCKFAGMPELPDIVTYIKALESRIVGERLIRVRVASTFLLQKRWDYSRGYANRLIQFAKEIDMSPNGDTPKTEGEAREKRLAQKKLEKTLKPPVQRSRDLRQEAVECFYRQWTRNNDGRTTLRDREGFEWVDKVPVTQGETALTIGKEAFRLCQESLSGATPEEPANHTNVQESESTPADETADLDPIEVLTQRLNEVSEMSPDELVSELRSIANAIETVQNFTNPAEPLVTVEQEEEEKRQGYDKQTNFGPIRCSPKPYHLTINRPQDAKGWLAAHDQLFLDGPTYTFQFDVLDQLRASLVAPPFSDEELTKPETPDENTCFAEYRRLMAQWVLKLSKDELDKLRKTIQRTSKPGYWEQFAKDLKDD
jgi:hypothetical protein